MSIIDAVQTFVETYSGIGANEPVQINQLDNVPDGYSIVPVGGGGVINTFINGTEVIEFPFVLQSAKSTMDDPNRLENIAFCEAFTIWMKAQDQAENYPTLGTGETPIEIETLGWGFLFEQGKSGVGVYQIQCRLEYEKRY